MKHFLYYLILGSNLDDRIGQVTLAKRYITEKAGAIVHESSLYETQPWGHEEQPWFINQVIEVNSPLEPAELLYTLKIIETVVGRKPHEKWHERHIDIDIILNEDTVIDEETLIIPHPLFHLRNFVLIPLMEIAPFLIHPVLGKSIEELYLDCLDTGEVYIFSADEQGDS
ncbi:MAG: 2-amino-4-hydroxy-6-hydroxymethyldihydropteridine diphosphokinase, partial [Saprospiraceae bacterium]